MKKKIAALVCLSCLLTGCMFKSPEEKVKDSLEGSWTGVYVEEYQIVYPLTSKEPILPSEKYSLSLDSFQIDFTDGNLSIHKAGLQTTNAELLSYDHKEKELNYMETSGERFIKIFRIEELTADSVILKERSNIVKMNNGFSASQPDTTLQAIYYKLKKAENGKP